MKPVAAEFKPVSQPGRLAWGFVCCCALVALASVAHAWDRHQQLLAEQARRSEMLVGHEVAQRGSEVPPQPKPYERSAREMLKERSLPWPEALVAMENVAMPGVSPRTFEANASDGAVRIEVLASDLSKVLAYLDALNAGTGHRPDDLRWSLQEARVDPTANAVVAVIVGRRAPGERF